ncbi:hypothetical protein RDABS01_018657 [Bienertia sinuspersici]
MADDLITKCSSLNLNDNEENNIVDVGETVSEKEEEKTSLMLIGRLLSDRPVNVEAFKRTMNSVWALLRKVVIRAVAGDRFAFQFFHWKDKEKVMDGRPWCFDQKLLILEEVVGEEQPSEILLNSSPFWVRLYNLPFNYRTNETMRTIASNIGRVLEVDDDELGMDNFQRVKIMIDVSKPLSKFQKIRTRSGHIVKVECKYERLPFFALNVG